MDKAFDVRSTSRLGCQSRILRDTTIVVEISRESRKAFLDEHPELRAAAAAAAAEKAVVEARGTPVDRDFLGPDRVLARVIPAALETSPSDGETRRKRRASL